MRRWRVAFALLAVSAVACNAILGNQRGDAEPFALDAAASSSSSSSGGSGGAASSSGSSASSTSSSGGSSGAPPDASSSASSSSSGTALTCACGADVSANYCALCPLAQAPLGEASSLAATDTRLWAQQESLGFFAIEADGAVATQFNPEPEGETMQGTLATAVVSPAGPNPEHFYSLENNHGVTSLHVCGLSPATLCTGLSLAEPPLSMASAHEGVLVLEKNNSGVSQFDFVRANTITPQPPFTSGEQQAVFAANSTTLFWAVPRSDGPGAILYFSPYPNPVNAPQTLLLTVVPRSLAANEEALFVAPCSGAELCTLALGTASDLVPTVPGASSTGTVDQLHADGSSLFFQSDGVVYRCLAPSCAPTSLAPGELSGFTRNARHLFLQIGTSTYFGARSPLRAPQ